MARRASVAPTVRLLSAAEIEHNFHGQRDQLRGDMHRVDRPTPIGFARVLGQRSILLLLLLGSFALRVVLAARRGQYYWPDEGRYTRAKLLLDHLSGGHFRLVLELLTGAADHTGFSLLALPAASAEAAATRWFHATIPVAASVAAAVLSLASVASIGMVFPLARKRGASQTEALLAAALMASATSMLYYSRHLLPYDSAMALALLACLLGSAPALWRAFLCGLCASLAFLTYNGYWVLGSTAVLLHLVWHRESIGRRTIRSVVTAAGFLLLPLALNWLSTARGGSPYLQAMREFSTLSRSQGDPAEGWFFPWQYLWHAEHLFLLVWVAGLIAAVLMAREGLRKEARIWILAVLCIYSVLAFGSAGMGIFGIFGRLVRQMVPFLCLVTAAVHSALQLAPLHNRLLALALALQFGFNIAPPLTQKFPVDVE